MSKAHLKTSLAQWQSLIAVIENNGFAAAAEAMGRSQSALSHAIGELQKKLGVKLLKTEGRRAVLTGEGEALLRRARELVGEAYALEQLADEIQQGREAEVRLVVDAAFPVELLMPSLQEFANKNPHTRVQLQEVVLSGADEALLQQQTDLAISAFVPPGFLGERLIDVNFIAVARADHPAFKGRKTLTLQDLRTERQLVIRDSGLRFKRDVGWLGAEQRWTVSQIDTAINCVLHGAGFAWLPQHQIAPHLKSGALKALPLEHGALRSHSMFIVLAKPDSAGPATRELAKILKQHCAGWPIEMAKSASA